MTVFLSTRYDSIEIKICIYNLQFRNFLSIRLYLLAIAAVASMKSIVRYLK